MTATLGMSARVVRISGADGTQTDVATLPSINLGTEAEGGSRLAQLRGITYVTAPRWRPRHGSLDRRRTAAPDRQPARALRPAAKPWSPSPCGSMSGTTTPTTSWTTIPTACLLLDGALLMTNAGGNNLYRVNPASRHAKLLATFDPLPGVFPTPSTIMRC